MRGSFVVCDLETTGLNPQADDIVEIGLVKITEGEITHTFTSLVRHEKPLPLRVSRLTGLNEEDFAEAPGLDFLLPQALEFIGKLPIIGHNVSFDVDFINANLGYELPNTLLDTLELSRLVYPMMGSFRLGKICEALGIDTGKAHRALDDSLATANLFLKLLAELEEQNLDLVLQLGNLIKQTDTAWKDLILKITQGKARNFADEKISGAPPYTWTAEGQEEGEASFSEDCGAEAFSVESILGKTGILSQKFADYEYRPEQVKTSLAIENALALNKHLIVEAGTGVGKSFAYLVPAILYALANKGRVVASTHTINLQEQLFKKDIPQLRGILETPFRASILKGRRNYLCLRRWQSLLTSEDLSSEEAFFLARILLWTKDTKTGDRAEFNTLFTEGGLWDLVCADNENCLGAQCSWFYNGCFLSSAKKKAEQANLIIINHSLLFSNLNADKHLLPSYDALIIDEAHHLEDTATEYLGREISQNSISRLLFNIDRYLLKLNRIFVRDDASVWSEALQNSRNLANNTRETAANFFTVLTDFVDAYAQTFTPALKWQTLRLDTAGIREKDAWQAIESEKHNLGLRLQKLVESIGLLVEIIEKWDYRMEDTDKLVEELNSLHSQVNQQLDDFLFIMDWQENYVSWAGVERRSSKSQYCYLKNAPVDVSELLYDKLFTTHERIIMTSATIAVNSSFDFFAERTGIKSLEAEKYDFLKVGSPFDLETQALFCIAKGMPAPGVDAGDEYYDAVADAITTLAEVFGGQTMVLFTSHNALQQVYRRALPDLEKKDILLLGQGVDGGRNALINEFKTTPRSVLLGAASFWEGVDLPGEVLKCVIIVRLPFQPPSIPVVEARLERLAHSRQNGFRKLSLPHAVLKFKQGFGRLIRNSTDKGVVVVLDGRITEKFYGNQFIHSLGVKRFYSGTIKNIAQQITKTPFLHIIKKDTKKEVIE